MSNAKSTTTMTVGAAATYLDVSIGRVRTLIREKKFSSPPLVSEVVEYNKNRGRKSKSDEKLYNVKCSPAVAAKIAEQFGVVIETPYEATQRRDAQLLADAEAELEALEDLLS